MTIGEKIKYVRKIYHMSSTDLAKATGIHPVSIRKYESNKMTPQAEQVTRIAEALRIAPAVFYGLEKLKFDFGYKSDCLTILMILYASGGLEVSGDRTENGALISETVKLRLLPVFSTIIAADDRSDSNHTFRIVDEYTLSRFCYWEYMYNLLLDKKAAYLNDPSPENEAELGRIMDDYDATELDTLLYERIADFSFFPGEDL
ncbi:MAG: helix-turn-helix transcriptional regulator [Lachnospiraceae bacterium]|nr:helix-turn-helix transcriptional regulator [Lachnospiraceae bacterium]